VAWTESPWLFWISFDSFSSAAASPTCASASAWTRARRQAARALPRRSGAPAPDRAQRIAAAEPHLGADERRELALRLREQVDRARLLPEHEAAETGLQLRRLVGRLGRHRFVELALEGAIEVLVAEHACVRRLELLDRGHPLDGEGLGIVDAGHAASPQMIGRRRASRASSSAAPDRRRRQVRAHEVATGPETGSR
jgi:hypothetical protein